MYYRLFIVNHILYQNHFYILLYLVLHNRVELVGNPNMDPAGPFYASVATLQRDRAKGMTIVRGEKDGPIFYENPYHAMPQNKNTNRYVSVYLRIYFWY